MFTAAKIRKILCAHKIFEDNLSKTIGFKLISQFLVQKIRVFCYICIELTLKLYLMKIKLVFILFLTSILQVHAQDLLPLHQKVKGGYNFWLYRPKGWNEDSVQKPLVVFLHGASLCGRNLERVRRYGTLDALDRGREIDAFVLAPQNPGGSWKPSSIMDIIEWVSENYPVDRNRVYVLGMSLGGYGTIDFCVAYPHKVAAAMAICGGGTGKDFQSLNQMPLWILHGTADKAVSIKQSDRIVEKMMTGSDAPRLIYTRLKGLNHSTPARIFYLKDTYDWLFSHSLLDQGRAVNKNYTITPESIRRAYSDISRRGHLTVNSAETNIVSESTQKDEKTTSFSQEDHIQSAQYYKVKSGDNLSVIAKKQHTTIAKLRSLNNLRSDRLSIGQRLRIR